MALTDKQGDQTRTDEQTRRRGARAATDWEAAFGYYGSLSPPERSYAAVAAEFGVSVRTVQTHGRREKWRERVHAITIETRARTADSLVEARVAEVEEMRRLVNASLAGYAEALRNGMRMSPADLERLNRLSLALTEEAVSPQRLGGVDVGEPPERTPEHVRSVIDALAEAGVLEEIGLTRLQPPLTDPSVDKKEGDDERD
jgi:flavin-binding protein dodecin